MTENQSMTESLQTRPAGSPRHYRTIWISDLHLGTRGCQAEPLTRFLKQHSCDRLYLVGDIIDGWRLRKNIFWPQSHVNVIRRILTLSKRGCEVVYVTGNHDEFLRKYGEANYGNIHLVDEAEHSTADGRRLLITHGDKFDTVVCCHKWIAHLGDVSYESLLVVNRWFNGLRKWLGLDYWSLSKYIKHRVKTAVSFISHYEQALAYECRHRGFDGVVCGHIHHPEIRQIEDVSYLNCGDWVESCSALVEGDEGQIEIIHWLEQEKLNKTNNNDKKPKRERAWMKEG